MPHRVTSCFNPQSIFASLLHEPKKSSPRSSEDRPSLGNRTPSISSTSSYDSNERTPKMPESQMKRLSLHGLPKLRSASSKNPLLSHAPAKLSIVMESPPLVFYGQPTSSTGALLSGQLKLEIESDSMDVVDCRMKFILETTKKRPFHAHCADCSTRTKELTSWTFLQVPTKLKNGDHDFPFSFLLKGDLPTSMDGPLSKIQYKLRAVITFKSGEKMTLNHTLPVKRAIFASEFPRQSIRIFPPTNLHAHVELPSVIHPIGESMAKMRLDGVIRREGESKVQHHWRLKRMTWRLEETHKVISPACTKHAAKVVARAGEELKTAHAHTDVRTIGSGDMRSGWKSDYSSADGSIELEFPFSIQPSLGVTCDLKDEDRTGTEVFHQLVVELIVAEEQSPNKKPQQSTPTGAARILRMHFYLTVTERSGLGIAWDEEQPPVYEDVPESPPGYIIADIRDYEGSPLVGPSLPAVPDYERLPPSAAATLSVEARQPVVPYGGTLMVDWACVGEIE